MPCLRFALLGSGSRGNGTLVSDGETSLLIDCGFSVAETERRLARLGTSPARLAALLVTHEHSDHAGGVARFAAKHQVPVLTAVGTRLAAGLRSSTTLRAGVVHEVGGLRVLPVAVPHDCEEPLQFVVGDGTRRIGVLTDLGHPAPEVIAAYAGCDALVLECNHDRELLAAGPYPDVLKARVGGARGHLSNAQAAALLAGVASDRLAQVVAAHLSETNNRPELARAALAGALGWAPERIAIAEQASGLGWHAVA
jgi:phosphoribosyl 1,2-cyclic phosphodiesterase